VVSIAPGASGGTVVAVALPISVLARTEQPAAVAPTEALPPAATLAELALPELALPELAAPQPLAIEPVAEPVAAETVAPEPVVAELAVPELALPERNRAAIEEISAVPAPRESVSEESLPAQVPVEAAAPAAEAPLPAALPARDILPARGSLQTRSFLPSRSAPAPAASQPVVPATPAAPAETGAPAALTAPAVQPPAPAPVLASAAAAAPVAPILPPVVVEPQPAPTSWQSPVPADSLKALAADFGYTPTFAPAPQDAPDASLLTARTPRPASDTPDPLATAFGAGNAENAGSTEQQDPNAARRDAQAVRTNLSSFRSAVQRARGDATDLSSDYSA
jgi:nicotinate-nucleotide--dimethylbenzimidazole phosphoribosyltransferase